jgi:hypothetical protein
LSFKQIFSVTFRQPIVEGNAIAFFLAPPQITSKIFRLNSQRFMKCFLKKHWQQEKAFNREGAGIFKQK